MRIVPVWPRSIDDYRAVVSNDVVNDIQRTAWARPGLRVLHVNSTEYGGGVAEVLLAQVPLLQDLGLDAQWGVLDGDEHFFTITKNIHNGLQGNREIPWTDAWQDHYLRTVTANIDSIPGGFDVAVVHDPQPMAIPRLLGSRRTEVAKHWIWRCHIDTADPHPEIWRFLHGFLEPYDAAVFTMREFCQDDVAVERVVISPPSIDPLSPKNSMLGDVTVTDICHQYQIDTRRPIMSQVSRFDPWKDPMGVIDAYHLVREEVPGLQLILAGSLANDDPEGLRFYDSLLRSRGGDEDLFILSNLQEVGNTTVNCFQRASQVIVQKSIREGFGLTVAEGAWKGRPVIGGRAGGITLQIDDGRTGYLVESVEECASRTLELLRDPEHAQAMGKAAHELIKENFLTTRELADWLALIHDVSGA